MFIIYGAFRAWYSIEYDPSVLLLDNAYDKGFRDVLFRFQWRKKCFGRLLT